MFSDECAEIEGIVVGGGSETVYSRRRWKWASNRRTFARSGCAGFLNSVKLGSSFPVLMFNLNYQKGK